MNEVFKYLKVPKIYVELLNLAGGMIFLLVLNFSFSFNISTIRNIDFLSGVEQTILLFLFGYFSGVLIQAMSSLIINIICVAPKIKLFFNKKIEGYEAFLGDSTLFINTLKDNPLEIHQAEVLRYMSENPILIAENATIQKSIIVLNFLFAYSLLLSITIGSWYFWASTIIFIVISLDQRIEDSDLKKQASLMMGRK